jgi:hypothetical protein
MQDLQGATTMCEMKIVPIAETVLQLQDNYSKTSFVVQIKFITQD